MKKKGRRILIFTERFSLEQNVFEFQKKKKLLFLTCEIVRPISASVFEEIKNKRKFKKIKKNLITHRQEQTDKKKIIYDIQLLSLIIEDSLPKNIPKRALTILFSWQKNHNFPCQRISKENSLFPFPPFFFSLRRSRYALKHRKTDFYGFCSFCSIK